MIFLFLSAALRTATECTSEDGGPKQTTAVAGGAHEIGYAQCPPNAVAGGPHDVDRHEPWSCYLHLQLVALLQHVESMSRCCPSYLSQDGYGDI